MSTSVATFRSPWRETRRRSTHQYWPRAQAPEFEQDIFLATPRACVLADAGEKSSNGIADGWRIGVGAIASTVCQPEFRPLAHRDAGLDRRAGLRALERALAWPGQHPLPTLAAQWVPDLADRLMWLHSTTVAGAAPESDRLPVLPEPALAGSPIGGRKVGKAGGDVKERAVLWSPRHPDANRHAAVRVSRDRARGRPRRRRRRAPLLPAQPQDHDQGRQVAGDRGRRRDREGDPRADRREVTRRTAFTARKPARPHSTPTTSGSSTRSTAPRRSCGNTRCSRRRSR